ncbi:MAG: sigma-70 family RNA polymerase sigma factor [Phycisphaerales bacterium JB063]
MPYDTPESEFASRWVVVQPSVGAYIRSAVRDAQHAEDVLQEVARGAIEQFTTYDRSRPFLNWVMGIARYRILNYYRSQRGDKLVFDESVLRMIERGHIDVAPTVNERKQALNECMRRLDGRAREALSRRYDAGMAVRQIAERFETTPNAISRLLYRARLALKECIESRLSHGGGR